MIKNILTSIAQLQWQYSSSSEVGPHKDNNEDYLTYSEASNFAIVCDGVGSNGFGDLAAKMSCDFLSKKLQHTQKIDRKKITELLKECHKHLVEYMQVNPETKNMATTVVLAIKQKRQTLIAWAGDSRAYLLRNGQLQQITDDHSFVNEKVAQGVFTKKEAQEHDMANLITSSLGATQHSLRHIGVEKVKLEKHDKIILCTDGVHAYINEQEFIQASLKSAQALTMQAIKNNTNDNCSAICININ